MHAAFITGGASGLGAACARRLARANWFVVVADRDPAAGARLVEQLGAAGCFVPTDVTSPEQVHAALEQAGQHSRQLRAVVQCAGIAPAAKILGKQGPHDLELFRRTVEVNLLGTFNVLRLAAQIMAGNAPDADGQRGVVVNTASIAATEGQVGQAAYAASKGGIASLTLPAARELAQHGIRVVTIAPGVFDTPLMAGMPPAVRDSLAGQIPFPPRLGRPEEFAALVEHVLANPLLNGCTLRLDGGLRMGAR